MVPKLGFSLQTKYDRPVSEVVALLARAGFSAVSPVWGPELDLPGLAACVRDHGMVIQSLHAPHKGVARLWDPAGSPAEVMESIDGCARFGIPILVVHGWQGLFAPLPPEPRYFEHFDRIVDHARELGVSVAFENLEGEKLLAALLDRYREQPQVGFCWDSGHDHCYPHKLDFLKEFGGRLIMTHLNDNFGIRDPAGVPSTMDDLHFLPFDGDLDWDAQLSRLRHVPRQDILNFELKTVSHSKDPRDLPYAKMPLVQFLSEAGTRARKIAEKYAAVMGD